MYLIFRDKLPNGWSSIKVKTNSERDIIKQKSEQELTDLLSDILEEGETWRDKYRYLSLDENGEVYLDMDRYNEEKEK